MGGTKAQDFAKQIKETLGDNKDSSIRINEVKFVAADPATGEYSIAAQLAAQALGPEFKQWLNDPQKLLQLILAAQGASNGGSGGSGGAPLGSVPNVPIAGGTGPGEPSSLSLIHISAFPGYGNPVKQPNKNFAPQLGVIWDPKGNGRTSVRGGIGLYYENVIFNNVLFDRPLREKTGAFLQSPTACYGYAAQPVSVPSGTITLDSVEGLDPATGKSYCCLLYTSRCV